MSQVRLRILGESVIHIGDVTLEPSATHLFALMLFLGVERGKSIQRSTLSDLLDSEDEPCVSSHNLRQLLYRLRRAGAPLDCTASAVRLPADRVSECPEAFLCHSYAESCRLLPSSPILLPGYRPPTSRLSNWLERYRGELAHKLRRKLAIDLHRARQSADWIGVEHLARTLLELDQLNETATLCLAEAMARTGSKHHALQLLQEYAEDVGRSADSLALPPRVLTRRIAAIQIASNPHREKAVILGRGSVVERLSDAWSRARVGRLSIVAVTGEKSIGKTRVIEELITLVRLDGSGIALPFRRLPADRGRPMSLFADISRQLSQLPGAAGCSPRSLPFLDRLTNAADGSKQLAEDAYDAQWSEKGTSHALIDLLDSVSSERPLLCCIDDSENLDDASLTLLSQLPTLSPSLPILVVVASNQIDRLPASRSVTLRLDPISKADATTLAQRLNELNSYDISAENLGWCVTVGAGNPGHLELLLAHTVNLSSAPTVPPDLISLVDSRLEGLSAQSRHALLACTVFGNDSSADSIAALTGLSGYELLTTVESLVQDGLLLETATGLTCRSALFEDQLRRGTSEAVRGLLHRRSAEYLERVCDGILPTQALAWRIADHWQATGERQRALNWRRMCWTQLKRIGQPIAAVKSIRGHLTTASSAFERAALLDELVLALQSASEPAAQLAALHERLELSDQVGDSVSVRLAHAADTIDARLRNLEDSTPLVPEMRALLRAEELDDRRRVRMARTLMIAADNAVDSGMAREAISAVGELSLVDTPCRLQQQQTLLIYHTVFGEREAALALAQSLEITARSQELSSVTIYSLLNASLARRIVDSSPTNYQELESMHDKCREASMNSLALRVAGRIASLRLDDGRLDEAKQWGGISRQLAARIGEQRLSSDFLSSQIDLALIDGDFARATQLIDTYRHFAPVAATPRFAKELLVYQGRVAQYCEPSHLNATYLGQLLYWHTRARHFGRHDDHMEVLWVSLVKLGQAEQASALLTEYLHHSRRERRPFNYLLRLRTAGDDAWRSLPEATEIVDDVQGRNTTEVASESALQLGA